MREYSPYKVAPLVWAQKSHATDIHNLQSLYDKCRDPSQRADVTNLVFSIRLDIRKVVREW